MSETTGISWADSTFNPWIGCTKVGPGCDNCYAERDFSKRRGVVEWGAGASRKRTVPANWQHPVRWNARAAEFQREHGHRQRVFCASLADVFDNEVDPAWRADLFALIAETPNLDWLLLTKRIGNAGAMINQAIAHLRLGGWRQSPWPWANVWLGATVVNQAEADRDIPKLLATPAAVRFLSIEPMLGPVNLQAGEGGMLWMGGQRGCGGMHNGIGTADCPRHPHHHHDDRCGPGIDWVIAGGESGPQARPSHPEWFRTLRDRCAKARVPFLFKQWGEFSPHEVDRDGNIQPGMSMQHLRIEHLRMWRDGWVQPAPESTAFDVFKRGSVLAQRVGVKAAGRLLDGVEHNGFPLGAPCL